ncbi:hypothetical protein HY485_05525 [Candidatus Woesearchaeota archaeon]|nr:hypothetical protein [Candidatus Woesearchaeota archaeon]
MMPTILGNVIDFFQVIGIYEVVLPFLLTFTIVFAILEKTKVFGTEVIGGQPLPRKNLNSLVAFVMGFLVLASAQLVEIITQVSSQVVVLLLLIVFFLTMIGTFYKGKDKEEVLTEKWQTFFMFFMFIGILFIFLAAIKDKQGHSWLEVALNWVGQFWTSTAVASIILIIVIVGIVWLIIRKEG